MRLFAEAVGEGVVTAVLLPFLGGSHTEWWGVVDELRLAGMRTVSVDLPGFGGSAGVGGYSVAEMAESMLDTLVAEGVTGGRYVLVGHSMGAKVSAVVARWTADGDARGRGMEGLVLVAGSPASPEPMEEGRREEMLRGLGEEPATEGARAKQRDAAERYVEDNIAGALGAGERALAVEAVLGMNRTAWRAWLESGSREDWSERVGVMGLPVLLVAGSEDGSLGEAAQRELGLPQWAAGRLEVLEGGHLLPLERPRELARLIGEFVGGMGTGAEARAVPVRAVYRELIAGDRVSEATRRVLEARGQADAPTYRPRALSVVELAMLRAVADRVVPQEGEPKIDLAARWDGMLADGVGDGWRFLGLPADAAACRAGLRTLDWHARASAGRGWLALDGEAQDGLLERMQAGRLNLGLQEWVKRAVGSGPEGEPAMDAEQMQHWFEDVRSELTRLYVAHPATLDRMGYSGIGDGAESRPGTGFVRIGRGEEDAWERPLRAEEAGVAAG